MPDPLTPDQWYIKTRNGKRGPYSIQQLQRYVDAGAILPNAGVGLAQGPWVAAVTVKGLNFQAEAITKLRTATQAEKSSTATQAAAAKSSDSEKSPTAAETLNQRAAELQSHEQTLRDRAKALDARGSELNAQAVELERRQADLHTQQEQLNTRRAELDALNAELAQQKEVQASQWSEQVASLEEREKTLADAQSRLADQQADDESKRMDFEQRESNFATRIAQLEQAETGLAAEQATLEQRTAELDQRTAELDQRTTELQQRTTELEQREQTLVAREQATGQLEMSLQEQARLQSEQIAKVRDDASADSAAPFVESQPPADDVSDASAESILEEKKRLLQEFAARQASLSRRESELMRREHELTRRELDIAVLDDRSSQPQPSAKPEPDEGAGVEAKPLPEHDTRVPAAEAEPPGEAASAAALPSSWEDVLGRADEHPADFELAVNEDPRYGPLVSQDGLEDDDQHAEIDGLRDDGDDEEGAADAEQSFRGLQDDRLPSEMLPSEMSDYDGVSAEPASDVVAVTGQQVNAEPPATAAAQGSLLELRRQAFEERFGPCSRYDVDDDPSMRVDVAVHLPEDVRDFTTLVTSGMSDYPIPMPNGQRSVRAELLLYVTHLDELAIEILRGAAKVPYRKKQGLSIGTTGSLDELQGVLSGSQQKDCVYMLPVIEADSKPIQANELIGSAIQLFWLVTITEAERKLIDTGGIHKFLSLLEKNRHAVYFDLMRECYVKRKGWFRR